jgi:Tfp pilus assembly protein PilF
MLGDMGETLNILNDAHKRWPYNPEISYYLALGYMDKGDNKSARNYFEVVISTKPDFYDARYNLGVICERLNDVDCFENSFRYLLLKNPDDASVLNYLGYSLADRGLKLEEATKMIEKAVSLSPEDPAYLDSLAWAYYKQADYDKAYSYITKSLNYIKEHSKDPDPMIYEHKGDILLKLNNFEDAYTSYWTAALLGSKNFDELNKKAFSIIDKLNHKNLLLTLFFNNPEKRSTANLNA